MNIFFREEELEYIDWSMSLDNQEIVINVIDTLGEKKSYKYSECRIEPTRIRSENVIYEKCKNQYNPVYKGIEIGDKYVLVEYCESGKSYLMKRENVEFLDTLESSDNFLLQYFRNVAQERFENAEKDKDIKEKVVSQFAQVPFIEGTVMDAYVNKMLADRKKCGELIYPFGINESQMLAVKEAFSSQISVIEGPPGTGKTQTILNIIANVIVRGKTCAVVSNNNDAVKNVYEKLEKYDLEFLVAKFGKLKNRETFFDDIKMKKEKKVDAFVSLDDISNTLKKIEELLRIKNQLAMMVADIREIEIEQRYLAEWIESNPELQVNYVEKYNLSLEKNVSLLAYMKHIAGNKLKLVDRWNLLIQFKIFNTKFMKQISDRENFVFSLQHTFYERLLKQKLEEKEALQKQLESVNFDNSLKELQEQSLQYLYAYINENRPEMEDKQFNIKNYKQKFDRFVKCFPIIGSSTYSIINSIPVGYVFDYVIIDEASQQDLIPGILCFGCAKNLVVVGDAKQLPHIPSETSYLLDEKYKYYDCQRYSLLDSISNVLGNHVRKTLLKEHYRCHPKIIQFCNKHFYENQLIPMTEDKGENALTLIITALGNHMRNYANQREIESVMKHQEMAGYLKKDEVTKGETVGFVAPYNNQVNKATEIMPPEIVKSTIHKFQGRECDKIIFSTVLDKKQVSKRNLDFVDNAALINVAVSRAKKEFILVTGNDVFKENNKHISALIRYIEYYAEEKDICNSPVISAFDLLYKEYDKSLEYLIPKLRPKDSNYKSEQIAAALLREIFELEKFRLITFHREIYLKQLVKIDEGIFSENEIRYINNRARCDFVMYYEVGKKPFAVIEIDGGDHDKLDQQERDVMKDSILNKVGIPICRIKTIDSEIKEKMMEFLEKCMGVY